MLTLLHNWKDVFITESSFKTQIITAASGNEQRSALMQDPRLKVTFSSVLTARGKDDFLDFVNTNQKKFFDFSLITEIVSFRKVNDLTIDIENVPEWVFPGAKLSIKIGDKMEYFWVNSVNGNSVKVDAAFVFPQMGRINRVIKGRFDASIARQRHSSAVDSIAANIYAPSLKLSESQKLPESTIFDGREVFMSEPNWLYSPSENDIYEYVTIDNDFGDIWISSNRFYRSDTHEFSYSFERQEYEYASNFFFRQKGQLGEFWIPRRDYAFNVVRDIEVGSHTLIVNSAREFDRTYDAAVMLKVGTCRIIFRKLLSVSRIYFDDGNYAYILSLDKPFESAILVSEIESLSVMSVFRFATDVFSASWETSDVCQTSLSFKKLPYLAPDSGLFKYDDAAYWWQENLGFCVLPEISNSLHRAVHVEYPKVTFGINVNATFDLDEGAKWLISAYGWIFLSVDVINDLNKAVNGYVKLCGGLK